jgi:hypothetical protein
MENYAKKNKIEKQYERFEANIQKIAEEEIKKIAERVEKTEKEAEKIGEEIEISLTEKRVKSKKSNTA